MATTKKLVGPLVHTVKIKILKAIVLGPGDIGQVGEIYELPRHMATPLVSQNLAEYTNEGDPLEHDETSAGEKEKVSTTMLEKATSRDPKPEKRK